MARPSKYHFDMLLKIEQPAFGHYYGILKPIRSAALQWAKSRGAKIKTRILKDELDREFLEVRVVTLPEDPPF